MNNFSKINRLPFSLSAFHQVAWVSEDAKLAWDPVFQQVRDKSIELTFGLLQKGIIQVAIRKIAAWEYFRVKGQLSKWGISGEILSSTETNKTSEGVYLKPIFYKMIFGTELIIRQFKEATDNNSFHDVGNLLGIPMCCQEFYKKVHLDQGYQDLEWNQALNTDMKIFEDQMINIECPIVLNSFWRSLRLQAIWHHPCSFNCELSQKTGNDFLNAMQNHFPSEAKKLISILSWPVEWSALHGIAEIKTPILKISKQTDAIGEKITIRNRSDAYPSEGGVGINFPYKRPKFAKVSDSKSFKSGMKNEM